MSLKIFAETACLVMIASLAMNLPAASEKKTFLEKGKTIYIDHVWSGAGMGFGFATRGDKQYVAYYDADRWMTIAVRSLDSEEWQKVRINSQVGWDSHNYVTFAFDSEGHIHLSGNMHNVPLIYYRTTRPGDITSFEEIHYMTGEDEDRVTYPRFYGGPNGEFLFTYRQGGSGRGHNLINVYDLENKTWKRHIEKPLFDGLEKKSAYASGPARDREGTYHLAWCWRYHSGVESNHHISYAQSPGSLDNWQKSNGTPIELPITFKNAEVIDSVYTNSGVMNSVRITFDGDARPMVTYVKFDPRGRTQIYTMRLEERGWKRYQTTNWTDRWEFSGGGTIYSMISQSGPSPWDETGLLYQTFINRFDAPYTQIRFLEKDTLFQVGEPMRLFPPGFDTSDKGADWRAIHTGINIDRVRRDGVVQVLRWETMAAHRDRPRDTVPPPQPLEVVELIVSEENG